MYYIFLKRNITGQRKKYKRDISIDKLSILALSIVRRERGNQKWNSLDLYRVCVQVLIGNVEIFVNKCYVIKNKFNIGGEISMQIKIGNIVKISPKAVYENGKAMPEWVKSDKWIVKSVSGERVVLGKNVNGTNEINSPVLAQFLTVISNNPKPNPKPAETSSQTGSTSKGHMVISNKGIDLIAKYEGCRLEAYKCPAGVWTIGYGHTEGVKPGDKLPSKEAAKKLLKDDLKRYGETVNNYVKKGIISFPLKQCQFDALTSFCYNCGSGSLQKLVSGRDAATVANKLLAYNKGGGRVLAGLAKRREEERAMFLS